MALLVVIERESFLGIPGSGMSSIGSMWIFTGLSFVWFNLLYVNLPFGKREGE